MLIKLEIKVLEELLKDGIKEMVSHVAGKSQDAKRRPWVIAVKDAIKEYQEKVKEEFLPILVNDFSKEVVITFSGGKISEEDKDKLKVFVEMVEKSNIDKLEKELIQKIEDLKVAGVGYEQMNDRLEEIKGDIVDGHKWIFKRIELHIRWLIKETLHKNTVERSQIEVMLYNFVDGDVPETVKKLFKNGMNSVPSLRLTKQEVDIRVENALLEYALRFGRRRIYGYN